MKREKIDDDHCELAEPAGPISRFFGMSIVYWWHTMGASLISYSNVVDVYEVRLILESAAARMAAVRGSLHDFERIVASQTFDYRTSPDSDPSASSKGRTAGV